MEVFAQLKRHCGKRNQIAIRRSIPGTHRTYGFVLAVSRKLVLLHDVYDFRLDGYKIFRVADIYKVEHADSDRTARKILRAEGLLNQVGIAQDVNLGSWQSVFRDLKELGQNIIVEEEFPERDEFVIGAIARVNENAVSMRHFDGTGEWQKKLTRCAYDDITSVAFDSNYITVFSRHLKSRN